MKFRPKKVLKKLRNLDISKANGPDGISSTVLKNCAPELAAFVAKLFQISFDTMTVPSDWKSAHVIAVPKMGSKQGPTNYRPISLLPIISKVMESHISKHQVLCDSQYGFREKRSTVDMFSYITQWWNNALDSQQEFRDIALDIKRHSTVFGIKAS